MSFKKVIISRFGGPEVLQLQNIKKLPEPGPGEVRIKVLHTTANFTDTMIRRGIFPEVKKKPPFAPGYDMVGVVDKNGPKATKFMEGKLVADLTVTGAYSEYLCIPEYELTEVPGSLDPAETAALILSYTTAYQMLHRYAKVKKGQRILVHGAAGAVGLALLQLGKQYDLEIFGTASSEKHQLVRDAGATPIDYRTNDFYSMLKENPGKKFDAAFDAIGGTNFKKSFKLLKRGGILIAYGFYNAVTGKGGSIPADFVQLVGLNLLPNGRKANFFSIGASRKKHPEWFKEDLHTLFQLLEDGKIKPVIYEKYPLEKVVDVHKMIEASNHTGKIVLNVSGITSSIK